MISFCILRRYNGAHVGGVSELAVYQYVVLVSTCYQSISRAWITIDSEALISGGSYRYGLSWPEDGEARNLFSFPYVSKLL